MCGIASIFVHDSRGGEVDSRELISIRDRMASRGPDGAGEWFSTDRHVGLAHRRLAIIDLSDSAAQPMLSADKSLAIVFNGEIYNHRELRAQLEAKGIQFRTRSDTEVLLQLYAQRGEAMLGDLRGMFAFALWDERGKSLLLARDPLGIKPLYFADDGKTLRVASQVKALLAGNKLDTSPDPAGRVGFFLWGHIPEPHTLFRSIRSLEPGTSLRVDANGKQTKKTFCSIRKIFADAERAEAVLGAPFAERRAPSRLELIADCLRDTVRHHLIADVPVGVFLSAGMDSTALTALTSNGNHDLRTVTLGFEEFKNSPNDETALAEKVAAQFDAQHNTIWITQNDFEAESARLFDAMDQPTTDGVNTFFVSLAAKRAGLKVALSGLGGDEVFGGYPGFTQIPRAVSVLKPFSKIPAMGKAFRILTHGLLKRFTSPKYAGLFEYGGTFGGAYLLRRGMFMPWELPGLLDADLVREGWRDLQPLARIEGSLDGIHNARLKVSCLETCFYMRNQLLRDADWAGMAHSVEIRVPFVDKVFLQTLAPLLASKTPPTKRDLLNAALEKIPQEILRRPKTGFAVPIREWMLSSTRHSSLVTRHSNERGLRGWARHVYSKFSQS